MRRIGEEHVPSLAHITTLAGYVHWQLTGNKVLGVGDASGMFPVDIANGTYDSTGALQPGVPLCPPEGDAGTGMVATNSVAPRTGNVSAGTSIFAMVVLEGELERQHSELDLVTTPAGTWSRWFTATTAPAN